MKIRKILDSKKGVSDMVSYVLLIVIALAISAGVYSWLRFYVPSQVDSQKCTDDVAIAITDYDCSNQLISLTIENKGYFTIDGFFARGTNDSSKLPTTNIDTTDSQRGFTFIKGRYDIQEGFKAGAIEYAEFDYRPLGSIQRIQLQPFMIGKKGELLNCPNVVDIRLDGCDSSISGPAPSESPSDEEPPISPTATCSDGIQNQDETGIDCGGAICSACIIKTAHLCYQETANASHAGDGACGLIYTGNYQASPYSYWNTAGSFLWPNPIDGNWATASVVNSSANSIAFFNVTYYKPVGALSTSLWQVGIEDSSSNEYVGNFTIPLPCWNANPTTLKFYIISYRTPFYSQWYCYNNAGKELIVNSSIYAPTNSGRLSEEGMWWNITDS